MNNNMNNIIFEIKTIIANNQELERADREKLSEIVEDLSPEVLLAFGKLLNDSPDNLVKINELFKAKKEALASGDLAKIDQIIKMESEFIGEGDNQA